MRRINIVTSISTQRRGTTARRQWSLESTCQLVNITTSNAELKFAPKQGHINSSTFSEN